MSRPPVRVRGGDMAPVRSQASNRALGELGDVSESHVGRLRLVGRPGIDPGGFVNALEMEAGSRPPRGGRSAAGA